MECSTEAGMVFDVGSLYAHFQTLQDSRNPKGLRYKLVNNESSPQQAAGYPADYLTDHNSLSCCSCNC